jgi:AmmeMemoRadiSam system protein B
VYLYQYRWFAHIFLQRTAVDFTTWYRFECADAHHSKRVFLLGPSHHFYLEKAALTRCTHYGTPLGNLPIDSATTADLYKTGQFDWMSQDVDEDEHSLEMHLPYIYKMLSK